jgi:hypothetical protein
LTEKYTAYTLVDITKSDITNYRSNDTHGYNQQQNLNTLIQSIGMRSQPLDVTVEVLETQDIAKYAFGSAFSGLHTVWKFDFTSEHNNVFTNNNDDIYFLKQDCNRVAFTPYLDETVNFLNNVFDTNTSEYLNIYFIKIV